MLKASYVSLVFATLLSFHVAEAAATSCPQIFMGSQPPQLTDAKIAQKTRELCFSEFAVLFSGLTRTPLYSAEHMDSLRIRTARHQHRQDAEETFHEEERLPSDERSWLSDYSRSGFDRGHLSPNGDFDNPKAQGESFSLANMMPQNADNNRNLWEGIEEATRTMASRYGEIWVVTVPIFPGAKTTWLKDRVAVPSQIAKAVYVPSKNAAGVYLVNNQSGMKWSAISLERLRELSGIDVFPALPSNIKVSAMNLPEPTPHEGGRRSRRKSMFQDIFE